MKIEISDELKHSLSLLGYEKWSEVQEKVIPAFLRGENLIVKSKTGSGKTCAFALPIVENIIWEKKYPQALILSCTRELAMQIKEECDLLGKYKKIKVQCVVGKENIENQKALLKQQCHILVGSVGRVLDLIEQGCIHLEEIKTIVIDEADYMMDLGFLEDIEKIMALLDKDVQKSFFSATYPEKIMDLINMQVTNPIYINIEENAKISHYYTYCEDEKERLYQLLTTLDIESALVFCERREEVKEVYKYLMNHKIPSVFLHGELLQKTRFEQLRRFRCGEVRVLVASDVAARGIDIDKVSHVFHLGNINNRNTYVHRSGRSGRVEESGISILLMKEKNEILSSLIETFSMKDISLYENKGENHIFESVEKKQKGTLFEKEIERIYINAGSEKKIRAGDIIGALCSLEGIEREDIGVIEVLRRMSYVEIYHHKADKIVELMKDKTIKKKKVKVEKAK